MKRYFSEFLPIYHMPLGTMVTFPLLLFFSGTMEEGSFLIGAPAGIILGGLFGLIINLFYSPYNDLGFNKTDFLLELNYLCFEVMNADDSINNKEKKYFARYINKYFKPRKAKRIIESFNSIESISRTRFHVIADYIENQYSHERKKNLFILLIGLVVSDRYLTTIEREKIYYLAKKIKYSKIGVDKIFSLYNFTTEEEHKRNWNRQKHSAKIEKNATSNKLRLSLKVLHLTESASNQEIKKAYRSLVKKFHPDRLLNANKAQKLIAEEEFLKIQEAYEYLKEKRDF